MVTFTIQGWNVLPVTLGVCSRGGGTQCSRAGNIRSNQAQCVPPGWLRVACPWSLMACLGHLAETSGKLEDRGVAAWPLASALPWALPDSCPTVPASLLLWCKYGHRRWLWPPKLKVGWDTHRSVACLISFVHWLSGAGLLHGFPNKKDRTSHLGCLPRPQSVSTW